MTPKRSTTWTWLPALLLGLPFLAMGAALTYQLIDHVRALYRFGEHSIISGEKRLVVGERLGAARVRTPTGAEASMYLAWIETIPRSSKQGPEVLCTLSSLGPVPIGEGAFQSTLDFSGVKIEPQRGELFDIGHTSTATRVGLSDNGRALRLSTPPDAAKAACAAELASVDPNRLVYWEESLRPGDRASVVGCARGTRIVPCGDGVDAVSAAPIGPERSVGSVFLPSLAVLFLASVLLAVFGQMRVDLRTRLLQ